MAGGLNPLSSLNVTARELPSATALNVSVVDGAGNQVTSFSGSGGTSSTFGAAFPAAGTAAGFKDSTGVNMAAGNLDASGFLKVNVAAGGTAGTQYTEADTDTTITGTAIMFESDTGTSALAVVNTTTPLPTVQTGALPAGANNIGDVDVLSIAAGDNNIGNVDVVTLPALSAGSNTIGGVLLPNLEVTEDSPMPANPVGLPLVARRRDTLSTTEVSADLDVIALNSTNKGELYVKHVDALAAGTNNIGDVDVLTVPAPLSTTGGGAEATALRVTLASDSTGLVSVDDNGGALTVDNAGTFAVQVDGAALTSLQLIDDTVVADDAVFTPATTKVVMAGFEANETSTDSVDEGDAGAARITLDRKLIVTPQPHTSGGLSIFRSLDIDETEEAVKTTAGSIYGLWVTNTATTTRWIKFYDATVATVVVGTTTPVITFGIPGNTSDNIAGLVASTHGIAFATAITVAATTGVADTDTGAPATNDVIINVFYK